MKDLQFDILDISNMSEEEFGKEIEKRLMSETLTLVEDNKVGYKGYLIPISLIEQNHLLQYLKAEPMIKPLEEYAKELTDQLGALKNFFGGLK